METLLLIVQGGGGGGGASREDVVYDKATELLERLPEDYIEDDYRAKLQKLGGLAVPLNIFLFQVGLRWIKKDGLHLQITLGGALDTLARAVANLAARISETIESLG